MSFVGNPREPMPQGLPFRLQDYIELVDWTGRSIRTDKRGHIDNELPPILDRLDIEPEQWLKMATQFEKRASHLVARSQQVFVNAGQALDILKSLDRFYLDS